MCSYGGESSKKALAKDKPTPEFLAIAPTKKKNNKKNITHKTHLLTQKRPTEKAERSTTEHSLQFSAMEISHTPQSFQHRAIEKNYNCIFNISLCSYYFQCSTAYVYMSIEEYKTISRISLARGKNGMKLSHFTYESYELNVE